MKRMLKRITSVVPVIIVLAVIMAGCAPASPSSEQTQDASSGAGESDQAGPVDNDDLVGSGIGYDYGLGPIGFDLDAMVDRIGRDKVKNLRLGVTVNSGIDAWPKAWGEEFNALSEKYGFTATVLYADFDSVKEADNIATFKNQQVDGIVISPIGPTIAQTLTELYGSIPTVTCIPVAGAKVNVTVDVDQEAKGRMVADRVAEDANGEERNVMLINNAADIPQFTARVEAFNAQCEEKYPNLHVVATVAETTVDGFLNIAKSTLTAHPEIDTIFAPYADPMMGGYNAAVQLGRTDIKLYGTDADETMLNLLKEGEIITGLHVQFAIPQADQCFFNLLRVLSGEPDVPEVSWEAGDYAMFYAKADDVDLMLHMLYPTKYPRP
ncbi:MAG: sugar ABC transporter substrate-binding protein [Clostridiales Family XIII bacterium]|jgi:ABC-type sugar transport system substrate-binding protein|nr:sugar ABC transporter substrate-binding protein [Clostridiales Family XIII bacterium]